MKSGACLACLRTLETRRPPGRTADAIAAELVTRPSLLLPCMINVQPEPAVVAAEA
jgi:hypothetical protein